MLEKLRRSNGEKGTFYGISILMIVGVIIMGYGVLGYTGNEPLYTYHEAGYFTVNGKRIKDNPQLDTLDLTVKFHESGSVNVESVKFNLWHEEAREWMEINGEANPHKYSPPYEWSFSVPEKGTYEFKGYVYVNGEVKGVVNKDIFVKIEPKDIDTSPTDEDNQNQRQNQGLYLAMMGIGAVITIAGFKYRI